MEIPVTHLKNGLGLEIAISIFFCAKLHQEKQKVGQYCVNKLNTGEQAWKVTVLLVRPYSHRIQHVFYHTEAL